MSDLEVWETAWYDQAYRLRVATSDGQAFQWLFADVMERAHPGDFQRLRSWGRRGDQKADGYMASSVTVFQCYAPRELRQAGTEAKIDRDLAGAVSAWPGQMKAWIFVHNDLSGAPSWLLSKRASLAMRHPDLAIELWGPADLWRRARSLKRADRVAIFGSVPQPDQIPRDTARAAYGSDDVIQLESGPLISAESMASMIRYGAGNSDDAHIRNDDGLALAGLRLVNRTGHSVKLSSSELMGADDLDDVVVAGMRSLTSLEFRRMSRSSVPSGAVIHLLIPLGELSQTWVRSAVDDAAWNWLRGAWRSFLTDDGEDLADETDVESYRDRAWSEAASIGGRFTLVVENQAGEHTSNHHWLVMDGRLTLLPRDRRLPSSHRRTSGESGE